MAKQQLPTMKKIREWVKEYKHSHKKTPSGYGPFFYKLWYWGKEGHVRVRTNSLISFKRICAALMDADDCEWRTVKGE